MLLRTKIFRYLAVFALIPSLIIAVVTYFLFLEALDQTAGWLTASTPDRTINSLRLSEDRLQLTIKDLLISGGADSDLDIPNGLDWIAVSENGAMVDFKRKENIPAFFDSILSGLSANEGAIREVSGSRLIIGYGVASGRQLISGGVIFERDYLDGFEAASRSLTEYREYKNVLPAFILFIAAVAMTLLIVVVITAYFFSRRFSRSITNPLERLTEFSQSMVEGGHPQLITPTGTEEVANLTISINRMITELEDNRKRLISAERVAAWQEFARRMAHELKNPLTPISISLYRIRKKLEKEESYQDYADSLEAISAEIDHLQRMATDYSSLASLPAPKFVSFDFDLLLKEVIELFSGQLEKFVFEKDIAVCGEIKADPDRLREVMVNLLKNGIQFTSPGGRIGIAAGISEGRLFFSITNDCLDKRVTDQQLQMARMPYYSTREGGTGLGLAISEKIIIDHRGSLTLHKKENVTEARFDIPLAQSPPGGKT